MRMKENGWIKGEEEKRKTEDEEEGNGNEYVLVLGKEEKRGKKREKWMKKNKRNVSEN